jgi:hypothetical protein
MADKQKAPKKEPPDVRSELDDSTVDLRAFARHYVAVILANEGITTPATQLAEAS